MRLTDISGQRLSDIRGDRPRDMVASAVGISVSALQMYENGKRMPKDEIKKRLACYYETTVGWLFFDE
ncbi:MAG: helix-turn-helix transcriptional regulator [Oscillospiraceae bacterium]|nr:helix-turn-helix transcriptional regulator [Oscillospiraceae bacterium]